MCVSVFSDHYRSLYFKYIYISFVKHNTLIFSREIDVQNCLPASRSSHRRWQHGVCRCPRPNMWARNTQIWLGNQSSHPGANMFLVRLPSITLRAVSFESCHLWGRLFLLVVYLSYVCRSQPVKLREPLSQVQPKLLWLCFQISFQIKIDSIMCTNFIALWDTNSCRPYFPSTHKQRWKVTKYIYISTVLE